MDEDNRPRLPPDEVTQEAIANLIREVEAESIREKGVVDKDFVIELLALTAVALGNSVSAGMIRRPPSDTKPPKKRVEPVL